MQAPASSSKKESSNELKKRLSSNNFHEGTNNLFKIILRQHTLTLELFLDQARYRMSYPPEEMPSKLRSIGNLGDIS